MTAASLEEPASPRLAWKHRLADRRVRAVLAVALAGLCVLAFLVLRGGPAAGPQAGAPRPATLKDLPALPEDIEAHGQQAASVLAPDDARARNAAVPFLVDKLGAARPFVFQGSDADRDRATECLATAALYEAGDDTEGEAAVAQVVLNRVRHAAFPATVCGVVYQGSQRATGCQFTFTCDGSLRRHMSDAAWARARVVAAQALAGKVYGPVGLATHYHTDWVYPYWSPELNKLARVGTHLFFGWRGAWGGGGAFRREYRGNEAGAAALIAAAQPGPAPVGELGTGILGLPQPKAELPAGMGKVPLYGNRVRLVRPDGRGFGLLAPAGASAAQLVNAALALCKDQGACEVAAWANEDDIPGAYPIPEGARGTMVFEYRRDGLGGRGATRFDCDRYPNRDPKACLAGSAQAADVLPGVRFKTKQSLE
ncbi:cell wall hydrolase [Novosphingobium sp. JCM 18896]|uniref:cell wall hydrolase n=1 Tax=Novosphingobium sp. JCM 18896 TaxID=2989731 RepID=UPI002222B2EA|nr:cell wall hydrolase [Novosphingobium sp. JCM 18896]MCW1429002.1 cell wall hydrolase [Novosphingobium sp. JCM 18896]